MCTWCVCVRASGCKHTCSCACWAQDWYHYFSITPCLIHWGTESQLNPELTGVAISDNQLTPPIPQTLLSIVRVPGLLTLTSSLQDKCCDLLLISPSWLCWTVQPLLQMSMPAARAIIGICLCIVRRSVQSRRTSLQCALGADIPFHKARMFTGQMNT